MTSLDNPNIVDAIGTEKTTGDIILTITDSWDWSDKRQHLLALQAKLNSYFSFIESGQIVEKYPNATGRKIVVDVITRFPMPEIGLGLLEKANEACAQLDVRCATLIIPGLSNLKAD